jgi:hypothetical protein
VLVCVKVGLIRRDGERGRSRIFCRAGVRGRTFTEPKVIETARQS